MGMQKNQWKLGKNLKMLLVIGLIWLTVPNATFGYSYNGAYYTFGNTDTELYVDSSSANTINAFQWFSYNGFTATEMSINMKNAFNGGHLKLAVYSDNNGEPGTMLSSTVEVTDLDVGWNTIHLTEPVDLKTGTFYWLVEWADAPYDVASDGTGGYAYWGTSTYGGTWPDASTVSLTQNTTRHSITISGEAFTPITPPVNLFQASGTLSAEQVTNTGTRGQKFMASDLFGQIGVLSPSWSNSIGNLTLKLYKWNADYATTISGTPIAEQTFSNYKDNDWLKLHFIPQPAGEYYWEASNGVENVGLYHHSGSLIPGGSYANGISIPGDYHSQIYYIAPEDVTPTPTYGSAITQPSPQSFKVGWATADITPSKSVELAGGARRISTGVHDSITATVMAVESDSGDMEAIMVSIDTLTGGNELQKDLREQLSGLISGFDLKNLFINATHTHTAPFLFNSPGTRWSSDATFMSAADYREWMLPRIRDAVIAAWNSRSSGAIGFAEGTVDVAYNRLAIYPDGHGVLGGTGSGGRNYMELESGNDQTLNLMYSFDTIGNLTGIVINIATPPQDVQGISQISADFWGSVRSKLQMEYPGVPILVQSSASGDQSPLNVADGWDGENWTRLEAHGTAIANEVISLSGSAYNTRSDSLALKHQVFDGTLTQKPFYGNNPYTWELHTIRIGNVAIANFPFELYVDYGFEIKAKSMAEQTFLVQLSGTASDDFLWSTDELNGHYVGGYLPTYRAEFSNAYGGYADTGRVGPIGGAQLVDQTVSQINNMFGYGKIELIDYMNSSVTYGGTGWSSYRDPGNYKMYLRASDQVNDYMMFTFTGTSIKWFDSLYSNRGKADIYIDDIFIEQIDTYEDWHQSRYQREVYRVTGLPYGTHTIKIVNTGLKNVDASDTMIGIDYFIVGSEGSRSAPALLPASKALLQSATASSFISGLEPDKATDGIYKISDGSNFWSSEENQDVGAWWHVNLGSIQNVSSVNISYRGFDEQYHMTPKSVTVMTSMDGINWTTQLSKSTNVPVVGSKYEYYLYNYSFSSTAASYVRLVFEDGTDDSYKYIQLSEVEVW